MGNILLIKSVLVVIWLHLLFALLRRSFQLHVLFDVFREAVTVDLKAYNIII